MENAWIIGGGKFGRLAAKRLKRKFRLFIVDTDASSLQSMKAEGFPVVHDDGVKYLLDNLGKTADVSWIIPTLPVHLAWEWCRGKMGADHLQPGDLPENILSLLPNAVRGESSHIYTSHADFVCPDHCSEPDAFCTYTGKPRKQDMHHLLASLSTEPFVPLVLKSQQLAPGIGGYRPENLNALLEKTRQTKGALMICTACRCHGVVTGAIHR